MYNPVMTRAIRSGFGREFAPHLANSHSNMMEPLTIEQLQSKAPSIFATEAHGSRSSRYTYLPTINVIEGLRAEGFLPFDAKQSKSRDEGKLAYTKHMIRFRKVEDAGKSWRQAEGLPAIPEVVLVNSHDGSSSYQMFGGLFRALCFNGLIVSDGTIETIKVGHKGNIIPNVIEGAYRVLEQTGLALNAQREWAQLQLTGPETVILAEAAHELRFERDPETKLPKTPIQPTQLLHAHREGDRANDLWTTFNVIQENCIKGGLSARAPRQPGQWRGRLVSTREVNGIDQDVKLNKALWSLAEKMAALKAQVS